MRNSAIRLGLAIALVGTAACGGEQDRADGNQASAQREAEGDGKTIGAGLDQNGRFFQAAKAAGLDATLTGPGPYTVLVPADAALAKLGTPADWATPEGRSQLTGVLTYHILPGTILAEDIGKAIDNAKGPAVLATMGGGTISAAREGDKIVLTDGAGNKATVSKADDKFSNGVAHHIDGVLMPEQPAAPQG